MTSADPNVASLQKYFNENCSSFDRLFNAVYRLSLRFSVFEILRGRKGHRAAKNWIYQSLPGRATESTNFNFLDFLFIVSKRVIRQCSTRSHLRMQPAVVIADSFEWYGSLWTYFHSHTTTAMALNFLWHDNTDISPISDGSLSHDDLTSSIHCHSIFLPVF